MKSFARSKYTKKTNRCDGKIEIVVNEDDESFDFETESTIYLGECFSDDELNELLEKNLAHIIRIKEEYKTNL